MSADRYGAERGRAAFIVRSAESRNAGARIPGAAESIAWIVARLRSERPETTKGQVSG